MSYRHWCAAVAVGLMVTCSGSGEAQEQADSSRGQASEQQAPTESLYPPIRVEVIENQAKANTRERREAEGRENEKADLLAQQGTNTATQRMADYAYWQTAATWVGAFLVFITLLLMIQANRAAVSAANAAIKAVKVAEKANALTEKTSEAAINVALKANTIAADNAFKQLRAYLAYDGSSLKDDWTFFGCGFHNYGSTPARQVIASIQVGVDVAHSDEMDIDWSEPIKLPPANLAPNQPMRRGYQLPENYITKLASFRSRGYWFYARVKLSYEDIFGNIYKTRLILSSETSQLEIPINENGITYFGVGLLDMKESEPEPNDS